MKSNTQRQPFKRSTKLILLGMVGFMGLSAFALYPRVELGEISAPVEDIRVDLEPGFNVGVLTPPQLLVIGARKDARAMPAYVNAYYAGGYPPEDEGTCTDLIWRAFMEAGIELKTLVDDDIRSHRGAYPNILFRDPNIDFRRAQNLKIFFERNAISLTTDVYQTDQWQAGDIVVFGRSEHIGIVSDLRNERDIPYLIHNNDQPIREEDRLEYGAYTMGITGHYRFIFPNP
jgi:uncharacterized protein YijF (DUF1287 family)